MGKGKSRVIWGGLFVGVRRGGFCVKVVRVIY